MWCALAGRKAKKAAKKGHKRDLEALKVKVGGTQVYRTQRVLFAVLSMYTPPYTLLFSGKKQGTLRWEPGR